MRLSTDAIDSDGRFDPRYTCDIDNSSPELRWDDVPEGVHSFAVIAEDLDGASGPLTHWVVYQIPGHLRHLPAGIPPQDTLPNGVRQGVNSLNKLGYAGPCPPPRDQAHRYRFTLYALRDPGELPPRARREQLLDLIRDAVLAEARVEGRYQRLMERAG